MYIPYVQGVAQCSPSTIGRRPVIGLVCAMAIHGFLQRLPRGICCLRGAQDDARFSALGAALCCLLLLWARLRARRCDPLLEVSPQIPSAAPVAMATKIAAMVVPARPLGSAAATGAAFAEGPCELARRRERSRRFCDLVITTNPASILSSVSCSWSTSCGSQSSGTVVEFVFVSTGSQSSGAVVEFVFVSAGSSQSKNSGSGWGSRNSGSGDICTIVAVAFRTKAEGRLSL